MGDTRFEAPYRRIKQAADPAAALRQAHDEEVIEALAAASRDHDAYLANVFATEALNRNREKNNIIWAAGEGLCTVSPEGVLRFLNPAAAQLLGEERERVQGRLYMDVMQHREGENPLSWEHCPIRTRTLENGETILGSEATFQRADGSRFPVVYTSAPIRRDGEIHGAVLVFRDVTAQREAARALAESEQRYRSLFEYNPNAVYSFDLEGNFLSANRALAEMSGYTLEELEQGSFVPLVAPEELERTVAHFRTAAEGTPQNYNTSLLRKDGTRMRVNVTNVPIRVEGRIVGVYGVAQDIEARVRAEEALRRSEERYRLLVENAHDYSIYILEPDGRIASWSAGGARLTGFSADDVVGQPVDVLLPEESRRAGTMRHALDVARREGRALDEGLRRRKDGSHYWAATILTALTHDDGSLRGFAVVTRDLTERKRFEEALTERERQYRSLFDNLPLIAFIVQPDGFIRRVNQYGARQLGYGREELQGRSLVSIFHADDQPKARARFEAFLTSEKELEHWEFRKLRKDGSIMWARESLKALRDEAGNAEGVYILCDDITEEHRQRARLEESRERYRSLFQYSPDGVFSLDAEGRILSLNPASEQIGGHPIESLEGQSFLDVVAPECRAEAKRRFHLALEGEPQTYELDIIQRDGRIINIMATKIPIIVRGRVVGVHGVITDVTRRKRAESLLRGQSEVLEHLATGAPLRDVLTDLCHFVERHSHGMRASVLLLDESGRHLQQAAAPSLPDAYVRAIDGVEIGPDVGSCGTAAYLRRPVIVTDISRDPRWNHYLDTALEHGLRACWSTPIFSPSEEVLGTFAMYYDQPISPTQDDVTLQDLGVHLAGIAIQRRRAEKQRQQAVDEVNALNQRLKEVNEDLENRVRARTRELEAVNQELESFSYTVSHDLRAPLRGIEQSLSFLVEDFAEDLPEEGRMHVDRAVRESQRLGRLIADLLQLSRVGRAPLEFREVDLSEMARDVEETLRLQAPGRDVAFDIQPDVLVQGDPALLRVVMENLLGNAWKFSSQEAHTRIEVFMQPGEGDDMQAICVRDNGVGFDMTRANRLFQPFQRLHASDPFGGTGIGLAAVRRIVERHGGRIWARSAPGEGATFCFTVPALSARRAPTRG